jgi:hypothetical protein
MTASSADHSPQPPEPPAVEELFRHVRPIRSADDLACAGVFETHEELDAFLAHVASARHADLV